MISKEYFKIIAMIGWQEILNKFGIRISRKSGGRKSLGIIRCPFHEEKHASLVFYETSWFCCFGCGINGDIFHFVQKKLGLSVMGVCKFFKKEFNVPLPTFKK